MAQPTTFHVPGGSNTFIRDWNATGKLQYEFTRNPKSFPMNQWCAIKSVKKTAGYWKRIKSEVAARVVSKNDFAWARGADMPANPLQLESFAWAPYLTERLTYQFGLDYDAIDQAESDIVAEHARINAQTAMTVREYQLGTVATTAGNWTSISGQARTDTATNLGGGQWKDSSATNQYILKTFNAVRISVNKATVGVIGSDKGLVCVVNPTGAKHIRESPEVIDFIKQQASSGEMLKGTAFFQKWGLPEYLYGVKMVVEDTVRISTRPGLTPTSGYILADTVAIFATVTEELGKGDGNLKAADASPIFDTFTLFVYEDMTVESIDEPKHRRKMSRIVDDWDLQLTLPESGYYVTAIAP